MDNEYGFIITEKGELIFKLIQTYKELGLSKSELNLLVKLLDYKKAPSARRLADAFGLIKTERIKAMLSRFDSLGFVKTTPDGKIDFTGLHKALDAMPYKSPTRPSPSGEDDEE